MTRDEAVKVLSDTWAPCQDALGLCIALEKIGAVKFDVPERDSLIVEAEMWNRPGGIMAISPDKIRDAARLIGRLAAELKKSA